MGTLRTVGSFTAFAGLLLGGWYWLSGGQQIGQVLAQEPTRYPADHVIHITAKLEFDGKPVIIDDLIDCLAEGRGTPTQSSHLTFRLSRNEIVAEVQGGGAIVIPTSRQMCYVYGNIWGDVFEEFTVPGGWTPVIYWFDQINPREAQEGIMYLSEVALTAENGRLRIVEDFQLVIPEYPASTALVAEAEKQALERGKLISSPDARGPGLVGSMVEIPESMWRNPDPMFARTSIHQSEDTNFYPMIEYLDKLISENSDQGLLSLGWSGKIADQEVAVGIRVLTAGRRSVYEDLFEFGIPKIENERYGTLISQKSSERIAAYPITQIRFDQRFPWMCVDGVASPDFENPGMEYFYREDCTHPDFFRKVEWRNRTIIGEEYPWNGNLYFDLETHSAWVSDL